MPSRARRALGRHSRGFTMVEMLTALAIIGILAAAASPVFVRLMRDNRVTSAATNMADMYRTARARAMGRGSAVLVRWNPDPHLPSASDPSGHLTMREAIAGGSQADCAPLPVPNCIGTDWAANSTTSKFVTSFDERTKQYQPAEASFVGVTGAALPADAVVDICFTPRGRTYWDYDGTGFKPLLGVPRIEVKNTTTSLVRQVVIPPNGVARVVTTL
jgi:prepilin-type N-terminal cleavage/methylation domain-containing protein